MRSLFDFKDLEFIFAEHWWHPPWEHRFYLWEENSPLLLLWRRGTVRGTSIGYVHLGEMVRICTPGPGGDENWWDFSKISKALSLPRSPLPPPQSRPHNRTPAPPQLRFLAAGWEGGAVRGGRGGGHGGDGGDGGDLVQQAGDCLFLAWSRQGLAGIEMASLDLDDGKKPKMEDCVPLHPRYSSVELQQASTVNRTQPVRSTLCLGSQSHPPGFDHLKANSC